MKKNIYIFIFSLFLLFLLNCNSYYNPPIANFTMSDSVINIGESIYFSGKNTNISDSQDEYEWTFSSTNNTETKTGQEQNITFNEPGTYDVTLKIINRGGESTYTKYGAFTVENNKLNYISNEESSQYFYGNPLRSTTFNSYYFNYTYPIKIKNIEHTFYVPTIGYWDNEDVQMSILDIETDELLYASPTLTVDQYSAYNQMVLKDFYVPDDLVIEHDFCVIIIALDSSYPYSPYSLGQEDTNNHSCYDHDFEFSTTITIEELGGKSSQIIGQ